VRLLLEAYYEPRFSEHSHGFRPGRGCHTALQSIYPRWRGTTWFVEGDIKACFDSLDHEVLLSILADKIHKMLWFRSVELQLYRRTVEIRDGMIKFRPFLAPGVQDPDLAAAVTADQIRYALMAHQRGQGVSPPAGYAGTRVPAPTTDDDRRLLLRTAAFFSAPEGTTTISEERMIERDGSRSAPGAQR
jgi:hypothetical protein